MNSRRGFTVLELMVAVAIGSLVILTAHRVFTGVADGSRALAGAREALDRDVNARRWLKSAFLSLEPPFDGRDNQVTFTSWQLTPGGWFEPRTVVLSRKGSRFVGSTGHQIVLLADSVDEILFDYLLEPGAEAKWMREWNSPVSAPIAVRVRLGRGTWGGGKVDTLLFLIKERG